MPDETLVEWMHALEPSETQLDRMEEVVLFGHAASHTSLAAEWLSMIRTRPLVHLGWALVAAAVLLLSTPLGSLSLALLR